MHHCVKKIQNALFAVGKTLESDVELWMKNINKSKYLKFDETTYTMYSEDQKFVNIFAGFLKI